MTFEEENQELRRKLDKLQTRFTHLRRDFLIAAGISGLFLLALLLYLEVDRKVDAFQIQQQQEYRESIT